MNKAYLLLGSNIEPRDDFIREAIGLLKNKVGVIVGVSSVYESEPWGFQSDTRFLNCVVCIETDLAAVSLLESILLIEENMGRTRRGGGYTSRNIDIDILYFNEDIVNEPGLIIPHQRLHERRFALEPLAEIASGFKHPVLGKTNSELLEQVDDLSEVVKFKTVLKI